MRNICIIFLLSTYLASAQVPKAKTGLFALTHATVETITKGTLTDVTLVIRDGKISSLGKDPAPAGATIIDCTGKYVYPGFIDGGSRLGLSEVGSDPRTQDYSEIGILIPQMKALTAVNPNSVMIPVARVNGVTTALAAPSGGLFCGTAALINLHGYTPQQMYAGFEGVVMEFPSFRRRGYNDSRSDEEIKKAVKKEIAELDRIWEKAIEYYKVDSATRGKNVGYYPEFEALLPVLKGKVPLLIEVNNANDILAALEWVKKNDIQRVVLTGVAEGWRVARDIAASGIPVITGPVISLPTRDYDRYDRPYANAGALVNAGVKVALRTADVENVRNLPYQAGFAVAYGMKKEDALRSITIVPAEIFGVSDQTGSIEIGKQANLFVCDGDPFETKTQVLHVFIQGWQIPMESRQSQLYDEFINREPGLKK